MSLEERLQELTQRLNGLPEADEPPQTTLQILGRSQQEQDWQRFLVHFLTPDAAHSLGHRLLEHMLAALSEREDLSYSFSRFDITDIQIEQEVVTENGRPDIVIWSSEDWFMCWELKVSASEGQDQTQRYIDVDSFHSIGLDKDDVPANSHHYVYLAPDAASSPEADEFVTVSWEWIASELQSFLADSRGKYPARTTAQLNDFIDTIHNELTMTDYQENQQEKAKLYIDHYDEISAVQDAFEDRWEEFTNTWGTKLAQQLDTADVVDEPDMPDEYAAVDVEMDDGIQRQWTFRQAKSDWSWLFPREWWTKLDESRPTYGGENPDARVGFLHRLSRNRDDALKDGKLRFYLRNAPSGDDDFYNAFAERFNADDEIPSMLPSATSRRGVKSNVLEATYEINVEYHDDFFEAYVDALARAMDDHVVSNPALVSKIDQLYNDSLTETSY